MKYLKLFEARKYDTIELSQDEYDEYGDDISVRFTDKEVEDLRKLFAIKGIGINLFGDSHKIVASKSRPPYYLFFVIEKLEDEWYLVYKDDSKYYKCDQFDGLKELLSEYIGSIPDNTKKSTEQLQKVRHKLLKQIDTKIKSMTNDQLEELLKKI